MDKEIVIVLIDVNAVGSCNESSRVVCERIQGELIEDFDNNVNLVNLVFPEDDIDSIACSQTFQIWPLSEYMDAFNNGLIDIINWYMTWVYTTKK